MHRGDVLGSRFEIDELASTGGMGQVFRARDQHSGDLVAVKVLFGDAGSGVARFERERRMLAELSHPGIVRYVAHGIAASGEPYLAMEWLDGEDLSSRLMRGALAIDESIELASHVARALGVAHAQNMVHRDLKPSNVFLVGGRIDQVKLLDFGIAWLRDITRVTRTGTILGTPGYMAPEQVQNDRAVDARADVFSLGCVLFECLTGVPAFADERLMTLLAKVVFAEPPRLRLVRPDAPEALELLLSRMLAKAPEERPSDGAAVVAALAALDAHADTAGAPPAHTALSRSERRGISVVLLRGDCTVDSGTEDTLAATTAEEDDTLDANEAQAADALRRGAEACGGQLHRLRDGSVVVSIGGAALVTDQAARAARCALWLRRDAGGRPVALATAQGELTGGMGVLEPIDCAVQLLLGRMNETAGSTPDLPVPIAIDELSARLLDSRFDVRQSEAGFSLHGESAIAEEPRLLLGKRAACVGRDRELSTLEQIVTECIEEPQAQAVLVTGPAGIGKSRLAQELLARLRQRGAPMSIWIGRGDELRAGSPLDVSLGLALHGICGIRGDEPLPERRQKISERVAQRIGIGIGERQRVTELLGEIAGTPFPDEESALLRAARRDAELMSDEMSQVWLDVLGAECHTQPVLLLLEDMQWGDWPTMRFVDSALRNLAQCPLMVLGLGRPEVHECFPKLWSGRRVTEIQLAPLGKKAGERLVRQMLGEEVSTEQAERLATLGDGNPFYLQELIHAAAEHRGEQVPETIVTMVQSKLGALDDEDRRVLRAASVFGQSFWLGGVAALLGEADSLVRVRSRLLDLAEVLVRQPESRLEGEQEFAFRHVLLREGAHAMLTREDCALGQRLAAEWLRDRKGES